MNVLSDPEAAVFVNNLRNSKVQVQNMFLEKPIKPSLPEASGKVGNVHHVEDGSGLPTSQYIAQ